MMKQSRRTVVDAITFHSIAFVHYNLKLIMTIPLSTVVCIGLEMSEVLNRY
jgi:hypothetical protein